MTRRIPDHWVTSLLDKLAAIYGAKFAAQWSGTNPDAMRDMWAEALGPYDGERIKWALVQARDNNPFPPTLPEFVLLCKQAPRKEAPALPAPKVDPEIAHMRAQEAAQAAKRLSDKRDYHSWAKTAPAPGFRASWESLLIRAAMEEQPFRGYLKTHMEAGVITSDRAMAVFGGSEE